MGTGSGRELLFFSYLRYKKPLRFLNPSLRASGRIAAAKGP
jgi:hypothetical protein